MSTSLFSAPRQDTAPSRSVWVAIGALSFVALAFLVWLIYFRGGSSAPEWVSSLPAVNAALNFMSAVCLLAGYLRIRRREITAHKRFMIAATCFSALFLVSYITYHFFHGDNIFPRHGWVRTAYLAVLASHVLLSMVAQSTPGLLRRHTLESVVSPSAGAPSRACDGREEGGSLLLECSAPGNEPFAAQ